MTCMKKIPFTLILGFMLASCRPAETSVPIFSKEFDADPAQVETILNDAQNKELVESSGFHPGEFELDLNVLDSSAIKFTSDEGIVTLYAGCRAHECDTKGYIGVDPAGKIVFFATQTYIPCGQVPRSPCSAKRIVFVGILPISSKLVNVLTQAVMKKCIEKSRRSCITWKAVST